MTANKYGRVYKRNELGTEITTTFGECFFKMLNLRNSPDLLFADLF